MKRYGVEVLTRNGWEAVKHNGQVLDGPSEKWAWSIANEIFANRFPIKAQPIRGFKITHGDEVVYEAECDEIIRGK